MADDLKASGWLLPEDLLDYGSYVVDKKMTDVELEMQRDSEAYPDFARAAEDRERAEKTLIQKYRCDPMEVDQLEDAMNASGASLAMEMYRRGVLDGGRIYHAFITGELPRQEGAK